MRDAGINGLLSGEREKIDGLRKTLSACREFIEGGTQVGGNSAVIMLAYR